jgi:hypothetical protein
VAAAGGDDLAPLARAKTAAARIAPDRALAERLAPRRAAFERLVATEIADLAD